MNVRTFIFTYSGDQDLILGKINNHLWAFPGMPIHVIDDARSPMKYEIVDQIKKFGNVTYETSGFDRKGNLNGGACIKGELEIFREHSKFNEIIIKTDPDSLITNPKLAEYILGGIGFMSAQVIDHVFSGYFYAMHTDVLSFVCRWIIPNKSILSCAPEDVVIGSTACACARMLGYRNDTLFDIGHNGRVDSYDYTCPKEYEAKYIERYCKGDDEHGGGYLMYLGIPGVRKEEVARVQKLFLEQLAELNHE